MNKIKFGTDGWRDIIADNFNFENLAIVVNSIAKYLKEKKENKNGIFIGYDNRFLSEEFASYSAKILSAYNFKVFLSEKSVPTPVTAFNVIDMKLDGALMITASHNPPKYSGIKFIPDYGGPATDSITSNIEKNISYFITNRKALKNSSEYIDENITILNDYPKYHEQIKKIIDFGLIKKAGLKIAADMLYGAGINIFPDILDELSVNEIRVLNNKRDAFFGGKLPDPSEKNLTELRKIILEKKFDIGLALDGDADRFGVIDSEGVFLSPNNVISLIFYYLCSVKRHRSNNLKAVRTVATTHLIDEICKKFNIDLIETPVGFKYIASEMLRHNVLIGGEESGGLSIKGHIPEKDGIAANLLMVEIQSYLKTHLNGISLSEYLKNINKELGYFYNERIDMEVPREKMEYIINNFKEMKNKLIENVKISNILTKDGVKLVLENNAWVLLRLSGTEPLIRCYIESRDNGFFNIFKQYIIKFINSLI
ncbi:MAG: phosphoglucomutase/phosphomannomutase family protein [Actinomycetota bacterium]|nr:phosphoglucomutase/phosphomannomutase family protein [Actinomycetota bacterium]